VLQIVDVEAELAKQHPGDKAAADGAVVQSVLEEALPGPVGGARADEILQAPEGATVGAGHFAGRIAELRGETRLRLAGLGAGHHDDAGAWAVLLQLADHRREPVPVGLDAAVVVLVVGAEQDRDQVG